MPQPKEIESYAPEFLELAERMEAHPGEVIFIPCPTIRAAMRLRFRLYGFQQAMKRDKGGFAQAFPLLMYSEVRLKTEKERTGLEIEARDRCQDATILRAALHPTEEE